MEALKLQIIKTQDASQDSFNFPQEKSFAFSHEAIRNMVKALEFSDKDLSNEIETFLVHSGEEALPEVVKGLNSDNIKMKSTCAMVMIRIGAPSIKTVKAFYEAHRRPETISWVIEFILGELGQPLPELSVDARWDDKVIALGCAV